VRRVWLFLCGGFAGAGSSLLAHDVITTKITWNREISRIVYNRCASCHRPGGSAFSLMTYNEARPWAKAIQEEVLERRMPPWGAVKGFGEFRDDPALTPEQIEVIADWVEGGAPEGENEKDLPPPPKFASAAVAPIPAKALTISGETALTRPFVLAGLLPQVVPENTSIQVTAHLPDGTVQPLLWLLPFKKAYAHPFILKNPLNLPRGTVIRGVPPGASLSLLPGSASKAKATP
jgi:hypothetical protein